MGRRYGQRWMRAAEPGFTLIEVLVAVTVFSVALLGISSMQLASLRALDTSNRLTSAALVLSNKMEELGRLPYTSSFLQDSDGDGAAGLDDVGTTADFNETRGNYQLFWNVAVDYPLSNTKTIKVWVQWRRKGRVKRTAMEYRRVSFL